MKRAVFTFATGHPRYAAMAKGLALSLKLHDTRAQRILVTDSSDAELRKLYDVVLPPPKNFKHWFIKLSALETTDADQILFVDSDGLAMGSLDPIFDAMAGCEFGVQGFWRTEVQWYGDMTSVMRRRGLEKIPVFSGGFLYYERTPGAEEVIRRTMEHAADYDAIGLDKNGGKVVDEVCMSLAMAESGVGRVFPDDEPFSLTPWGLVGDLHVDAIKGECRFIKGQADPKARRPLIYHSAHAKWDHVYWRELRRLFAIYRRAERLGYNGELLRLKHLDRLRAEAAQWLARRIEP